ncbi:MAG: DNA repair protein RecN [Acutalibacteraceae bacterium]
MLANLKIENIAIIESASIDFTSGLNVMSGETGAGKSIILDSLNTILGERTSKDLVRSGAKSAKVSAMFYDVPKKVIKKLEEFDIEPEDDNSLLIQRSINLEGKNTCRINGFPITVTMLKSIGKELVNIHGQHDSQTLLNSDNHFEFIDALAENNIIIEKYKIAFNKMISFKKELKAMNINEEEKAKRIDFLQFQINELELADIKIGEKDGLLAKKEVYQNSEKIVSHLHNAYELLNGTTDENGANSMISFAADNLEKASSYLSDLQEISEKVREISYNIEEFTSDIRNTLMSIEYEPSEIEETEERLDMLYKLSLKFGDSEEEMVSYLNKAKDELNEIMFSDERIEKLKLELKSAEEQAAELAEQLSQVRRKTAIKFEKQVKEELAFLDMPSIEFIVNQVPVELNENGADNIEFLISTNIGEQPKPLSKIASGGELSRIMLAIKNVLSEKDEIGTLIFDEIDTGVSGRAAQKIALKLSQVSKGRQVICVTHSAQIAAYADNHLLIEKETVKNKTYTKVKSLDIEGRKMELARIIGGISITQLQLDNAEEMLKSSNIIQGEI